MDRGYRLPELSQDHQNGDITYSGSMRPEQYLFQGYIERVFLTIEH